MRHLTPEECIDLLDGTCVEADLPHLADCAECQRQVAGLRATWQAAFEADVPEPSPLFWDHMSARVHAAVEAEGQERNADAVPTFRWALWSGSRNTSGAQGWRRAWSWNVAGLAGAAAAAVLLAVLIRPAAPVAPSTEVAPAAADAVAAQAPLADDESMGLVADLASHLDWDGVAEVGWSSENASARAVGELTDDERVELRRLLTEAIGGTGSSDL